MGRGLLFIKSKENSAALVSPVITLIVVGVVLYLINMYIPMASSIRTILNVVVVVAVGVWVLRSADCGQG